MNIRDHINSGDWILVFPKKGQWLGQAINTLTFGKVSHAVLVVDKDTLFETDGDIGKAIFTKPEKYEARHLAIVSPVHMKDRYDQILAECKKLEGSPYSYWDIFTNASFFWLAAPIRKKVVSFFGSKRFMVCSELVARITYEATESSVFYDSRAELMNYEGLTPEDLRDMAFEYPEEYKVFEYNKPK
jgi:hypothetical protein